MTIIIQENYPNAVELAKSCLQQGQLIAFCTDTVYGLAADAFNQKAIHTLYHVKSRDSLKAIPIMVGRNSQLAKVVKKVDYLTGALIKRFWPGALTVILNKKDALPTELSQYATVGIRMPNHAFCLKLLRKYGPLAVTSANVSGAVEAHTAEEVNQKFQGKIALLIDGGKSPGGIPSTVIDCTSSRPIIIREGAIKFEEITTYLSGLK